MPSTRARHTRLPRRRRSCSRHRRDSRRRHSAAPRRAIASTRRFEPALAGWTWRPTTGGREDRRRIRRTPRTRVRVGVAKPAGHGVSRNARLPEVGGRPHAAMRRRPDCDGAALDRRPLDRDDPVEERTLTAASTRPGAPSALPYRSISTPAQIEPRRHDKGTVSSVVVTGSIPGRKPPTTATRSSRIRSGVPQPVRREHADPPPAASMNTGNRRRCRRRRGRADEVVSMSVARMRLFELVVVVVREGTTRPSAGRCSSRTRRRRRATLPRRRRVSDDALRALSRRRVRKKLQTCQEDVGRRRRPDPRG